MSTRQQAERMLALFEGNKSASGTHKQPVRNGLKWEIKTTAKTLREPVTVELWQKHLEGERPLGVIPINEQNMCRWGSIDVDEYDIDLIEMVRRAEKLPLVPCRSKSGGLHFFMFVGEFIPAGDMLSTLRALAASMGLAGCEIFPKQSHVLTERGDMGNWMVMPYYGDTFDGKLQNQFGIKKNGGEMTLQEFISTATKATISKEEFDKLAQSTLRNGVASIAGGKKRGGKSHGTISKGPFGDGPPCLQHMATGGFPEGSRNNSLFMIGIYLKQAFPADWQRKLEEDNQTFMKPPLTSDEVTQVRKQLEKKDYEYTCKNEPMASHCDSGVCRTRKFGVGSTSEFPEITAITKLKTEPAIWFLTVGGKRVEVSSLELLTYTRFQLAMVDQHSLVFSSMKQTDWVRILGDAMRSGLDEVDMPQDASTHSVFVDLLQEFLTNRTRGERFEDLLSGRPFFDEEKGVYQFRRKDFDAFLKREGVKEFSRGQISRRFRDLDVKTHFKLIKGTGTNYCMLKAEKVQPVPKLDTPSTEGEEI